MSFEEMQKTWQAQDANARVTINTDLLLKEVRRNQRQFWATIFWRDLREVIVAIGLTVYFSWQGAHAGNWTDYLVAAACLFVAVFFIADRFNQRRKQLPPNHSLKGCVENSLAQVSHQIWLLKNVFWWYLLPLLVPLLISMLYPVFRGGPGHAGPLIAAVAVIVGVFGFVYWVNQYAVRKSLHPRREELENLLASLN
jgi:hypothetical protein